MSQSVEHDHPNAMVFLRKDCSNITDFWYKKRVNVWTTRQLFDFIVNPTLSEEDMALLLEQLKEHISSEPRLMTEEEKIEEQVFMQAFIPRTLDAVRFFQKAQKKVYLFIIYYFYYDSLRVVLMQRIRGIRKRRINL